MAFYPDNQHSQLLKAALGYAAKGIPVFPLKPGCKKPLITDWPNRATTDQFRINMWWHKWPDANIGVPTGERSRLLVLDVDPDKGGGDALIDLERRHGKLPATTIIRTGSGGMHYYLAWPADEKIGNSASKLGAGLDVRGEGGYIVVPPSRTTGIYKTCEHLGHADPPPWLLERLRERSRGHAENTQRPGPVPLDGGAISEGVRNDALTRMCGRLHDGSRDVTQLAADLAAINEARCEPPLPAGEVEKIARSIHGLEPCKAAPQITPRTRAMLAYLEDAATTRPVRGVGGASGWSIYRAYLDAAPRIGREHPDGIEISLDVRSCAQLAGTHAATVSRFNRRSSLVRPLRRGSGRRSGSVVLLVPREIGVQLQHSSTRGVSQENTTPRSVATRPLLRTLQRLRWGPGRIGKSRAAILSAMLDGLGECSERVVSRFELAAQLGRKPDSLKKPLRWLLDAGLIVRVGHGLYALAPEFERRLEEWRETGKEPEADRLQIARHDRERDGYRRRHKVRPGRVPSEREMQERRESYPERRRQNIEEAIARLFAERPEYRGRRAGQVTCALAHYLPNDFPLGEIGLPKDAEVEAILDGVAA